MRVVVTGGAGYIGSIVAEILLTAGHQVVIIDNLSRGHRDAVPAGAEFVQADISSETTRIVLAAGVDAVMHFAASSLVGESCEAPAAYYQNNVVKGLALLEAVRAAGIGRFVFSSTAAVYGQPDRQPIREDAATVPTNPYGDTKLAFERALAWYAKAYGLSCASLRYFNAAGATDARGERHEPETHLIPLLLHAAAGRRPPVTIYGTDYPTRDGTCVRDYIHVRDLADAHLLALSALGGPGDTRIYNLGCGGGGYTVREVVEAAARVLARPVPVSVGPRRPGDPAMLVASSDKIQRELGWKPQADLESIIRSAWRHLSAD